MSKEPNTRLTELFARSGWSKGELARAVNRTAAAMGCAQLATDTSRVRRWMETGEVPRDPVPGVLATLFTERLGRVVTIEDLGFARTRRTAAQPAAWQGADPPPWPPGRTAEVLTEFTGMDLMLNRRGLMGTGSALAAGSALTGVLGDWLTAAPHGTPARSASAPGAGQDLQPVSAGPVGTDEIGALERSVDVFRAWDASRGGGLQRKAVVGQLNEVGSMLEERSHPAHLQRRLWAVSADLAVLAGWMSHDVGLEPTAQRYFVIAVHAAKEAGDQPRAAEALSRAARQMVHVGRPADAADIMDLAIRSGGPTALPRTRSMFCTIDAWAQAAMGRSKACRARLAEAEKLFAAGSDGRGEQPGWMQLFDEADLHGMEGLALRTLAEHDPSAAPAARHHAEQALELRVRQGRERSTIFDRLSLAGACALAGEPEEAAAHARPAVAEARQMSSRRTWDRLTATTAHLEGCGQVPEVRALREELALALPGGALPPQRRAPSDRPGPAPV